MTFPGSLDPGALAKGVHDTLDAAFAAIPEGHTHAVVFDGTWDQASGGAINAMFVQKAPDGWNVVLEGGYDGPQGVNGKVVLAKSW